MVLAVALSASRTGALSLGVLLLWAMVDRSLPRTARWTLALAPVAYLVFWAGLAEYAASQHAHYYAADRLQSASEPSPEPSSAVTGNIVMQFQVPHC